MKIAEVFVEIAAYFVCNVHKFLVFTFIKFYFVEQLFLFLHKTSDVSRETSLVLKTIFSQFQAGKTRKNN